MMSNLSSRKNLFAGFVAIMWVANRCYGQDKRNAGVIMILKDPQEMDLQLTGPSDIKTLKHGIAMLKNLQALPVIKMDCLNYPTAK